MRSAGRFVNSLYAVIALITWSCDVLAQEAGEQPSSLGEPLLVEVHGERVANLIPSETFPSIATALRYEPLVDLQVRNLGEAQGDVVIRGGTFETSGVQLGAMSLFDPQTGHYLLELPLEPEMLAGPNVITGAKQALGGFQATSGSVHFDFSAIEDDRLMIGAGGGDHETNLQQAYGSLADIISGSLGRLGADFGVGRSESDGSRDDGDSSFERISTRFQLKDSVSQTDVFLGRHRKDFSWPYLYALKPLHELVGSSGIESEDISSTLFLVNHKRDFRDSGYFEAGAFMRKSEDDYEFDRFQPGLFNDFRHTTRMLGAAAQGAWKEDRFELSYKSELSADDLDSTALTFGPYQSRRIWKVAALPGYGFALIPDRMLWIRAGAGYVDGNRVGGRISPIAGLEVVDQTVDGGQASLYAEISQTAQDPGYTALGSNPASGLFRGNPNLGRSLSTNYEIGLRRQTQTYSVDTALFYRYDDELVDWTYQNSEDPVLARTAENVDLRTFGVETVGRIRLGASKATLGYTYISKDDRYESALVDASFYALNYPKHRITTTLELALSDRLDFRLDNEIRVQEPNLLRTSDGTRYYLGAAALTWSLPWERRLEISLVVDNFTNDNFEEIPGVPGAGRSIGLVARGFW